MTAVTYDQQIEHFMNKLKGISDTWRRDEGRLYDKVYMVDANSQPLGRFMVERSTGNIYAIKSWNQHNPRRLFGTLDSVDQWNWTDTTPEPIPGTDAEKAHIAREEGFKSTYKKRGRPTGVKNKKTLSTP